METKERTSITIETTIQAPVEKVWRLWTEPEHIVHWNYATEDWHTPWAKNDLRVGGQFTARMEARNGSMGFDFGGIYEAIVPNHYIEYVLGDGRMVKVTFTGNDRETKVVENFEAEDANSVEMQRSGWQSILDNFKQYTETQPG